MIFRFGPNELKCHIYDKEFIKQFIEKYPDYTVEISQEEASDINDALGYDDEYLQDRWGLLMYIEVNKNVDRDTLIERLKDLYSLQEEEFDILDTDKAKCYPITNLFQESGVYPLTDIEVGIIEASTFNFDTSFNQYIEHISEQSKKIIRGKVIDRKWKLNSMRHVIKNKKDEMCD